MPLIERERCWYSLSVEVLALSGPIVVLDGSENASCTRQQWPVQPRHLLCEIPSVIRGSCAIVETRYESLKMLLKKGCVTSMRARMLPVWADGAGVLSLFVLVEDHRALAPIHHDVRRLRGAARPAATEIHQFPFLLPQHQITCHGDSCAPTYLRSTRKDRTRCPRANVSLGSFMLRTQCDTT